MPIYTELLRDIRQIAQMPTATLTQSFDPQSEVFTDEGIIRLINQEMKSHFAPLVMSSREEFFVITKDYNYSSGQRYPIPSRAVGAKLRNVCILRGTDKIPLARVELDDERYTYDGFSVEGNYLVVLNNAVGTTDKLRVSFFARPADIFVPASPSTYTSTVVDFVNNRVHLATDQFSAGSKVDLVRNTSPFDVVLCEATVLSEVAVSGFGYVLDQTIPADAVAGFRLYPAGQSEFPCLPEDLQPILAHRVALRALEGHGDPDSYKRVERELSKLEQTITWLYAPRVDGKAKKIRNHRLLGQ